MKLETSITVDVISNEDGTYNTYISHEGSSGEQYEAISAQEIGKNVADLVDTLEEALSGNSYLGANKKFVLAASNGRSIEHTVYTTYESAYNAMKTAVERHIDIELNDLQNTESSWLEKNSAYVCHTDKGIISEEDWIWDIIPV